MMDSRSGPRQKQPDQPHLRPMLVEVLFIKPSRAKTPWWVRRAKLKYSHVVLSMGGVTWDQPWDGTAEAYDTDEWIRDHDVIKRGFTRVDVTYADHDPWLWIAACKRCEGRRCQRLRSALRWLHLWPRPAWNCTSPVRVLLKALDHDEPLTGETPDAILRELITDD